MLSDCRRSAALVFLGTRGNCCGSWGLARQLYSEELKLREHRRRDRRRFLENSEEVIYLDGAPTEEFFKYVVPGEIFQKNILTGELEALHEDNDYCSRRDEV